MDWNSKILSELRKRIPQQIAEEIRSVQPIDDITIDDLRKAFLWLQASRIARGAYLIKEEPLEDSANS